MIRFFFRLRYFIFGFIVGFVLGATWVVTDVFAATLTPTSPSLQYHYGCVITEQTGNYCPAATFSSTSISSSFGTLQYLPSAGYGTLNGNAVVVYPGVRRFQYALSYSFNSNTYYKVSFTMRGQVQDDYYANEFNKSLVFSYSTDNGVNYIIQDTNYTATVTKSGSNYVYSVIFKPVVNFGRILLVYGSSTGNYWFPPIYNDGFGISSPYRADYLTLESVTEQDFLTEEMLNQQKVTNRKLDEMISNAKKQLDSLLSIINGNDATNDKLDDLNKNMTDETENSDGTCRGLICNVKKVVRMIIDLPKTILNATVDAILKVFVPEDMNFINNFVNVISNKLGFIASIPLQLIDFIIQLGSVSFSPITSINFPTVNIFGYSFWNAQSISINDGLSMFTAFKYLTDLGCVVICIRTLHKWKERFTGG